MEESRNGVMILDNIPANLDAARVLKQMHLHGDTKRYEQNINELIELVTPIARPKAVYKVSCIENKSQDSLEIDGVKFTGRLVRDTLDKADTVFVCVATCGIEVEKIEIPPASVMKRYCLDVIKMALVFSAITYLNDYLKQHFNLGEISSLNPGELKAFPSTQHKKVFSILGDVEGMIGVRLTEYCALVPTKSHSGIYFSTDTKFISCRMCTQKRCMGRRAPFDAELAKQYPA